MNGKQNTDITGFHDNDDPEARRKRASVDVASFFEEMTKLVNGRKWSDDYVSKEEGRAQLVASLVQSCVYHHETLLRKDGKL